MLNFGIFVLISNRHRDPWQALTHYRRRNDIETSYHMIKSELDGARARCWDMKRVRGKELCRLIALGYRFYLQNALKATRKEAEQLSRDEECGKVERRRGLAQENEPAPVPGLVRLRRDRHRPEQACQVPLVYRKHDEGSTGASDAEGKYGEIRSQG